VAGESPAVARRRLRFAIRRAREAAGLTQSQVAEALVWSLSKVNRIEKGDVTVSSTDLRALLHLLNISDEATVAQLTADARTSRQRGWWDNPRYREHLTAATLQLLQFEAEATAIRTFQPTLVPGLLQTRAYAQAVLERWRDDLGDAAEAVRLEVRINRAAHVLDSPDPPTLLVVLDESVILRRVGGAEIMKEQLEHLLTANERPNVIVRVLPLADGADSMYGSFTIMDLGDEENAILYLEGIYKEAILGDEILHTPDVVRRHRRRFETMWEQSLTPEATIRSIEARRAVMRASMDRDDPTA
jgi:transcriptional regulator with XRE-family HTH domain